MYDKICFQLLIRSATFLKKKKKKKCIAMLIRRCFSILQCFSVLRANAPVTETIFTVHRKRVCCELKMFAPDSNKIVMHKKNITRSLLRSNQTFSVHFYCFYCGINMRLDPQKTFKKYAQRFRPAPAVIILGQKRCRIPS